MKEESNDSVWTVTRALATEKNMNGLILCCLFITSKWAGSIDLW